MVRSMLVTDVGDEMRWRQHKDVGDDFDHSPHQYPQYFSIDVGHQHSKVVTNIYLSPVSIQPQRSKIGNTRSILNSRSAQSYQLS